MLKPIRDFILLEPIKEDKIIDLELEKKGKVIAVGSGKISAGVIIPLEIKEGDIVHYTHGRKVDDYILVNESDIIGVENE